MRLYLFPPSSRALGVVALKNHLAIDCELRSIDLGRGDQRAPEYVALNPNRKITTLEDDGFVLWEANAILFYLALQCPERGLWPADVRGQADVLRWLAWESAHWDAESCGMVTFEKNSKLVLGLGPPDPAFIARGEQRTGDAWPGEQVTLGPRRTGDAWPGEQVTLGPRRAQAAREVVVNLLSGEASSTLAGTVHHLVGRLRGRAASRTLRNLEMSPRDVCRDCRARPAQLSSVCRAGNRLAIGVTVSRSTKDCSKAQSKLERRFSIC